VQHELVRGAVEGGGRLEAAREAAVAELRHGVAAVQLQQHGRRQPLVLLLLVALRHERAEEEPEVHAVAHPQRQIEDAHELGDGVALLHVGAVLEEELVQPPHALERQLSPLLERQVVRPEALRAELGVPLQQRHGLLAEGSLVGAAVQEQRHGARVEGRTRALLLQLTAHLRARGRRARLGLGAGISALELPRERRQAPRRRLLLRHASSLVLRAGSGEKGVMRTRMERRGRA
jgi:hypothetical protein